ncbi:adenosylcobinamide-phosphate synthase CbiB [Treponema sp.]|uniref:adenosylcobinamide-phosphate synthase CbiB n=1 Tax=Treponema sp. TaxID=166 RepID=UPI00388DD408
MKNSLILGILSKLNSDYLYTNHIILSTLAGFLLDCFLGDPHFFPHPVKFMGKLISFLELKLNKADNTPGLQRLKGLFLVNTVIFLSFAVSFFILLVCRKINFFLFFTVESVMCYQCIAARSLCHESMKVYKFLSKNDIENAREAVSMIVGRDTDILDKKGIAKAAVETVAENTSDGVVAPLFYMVIFGPIGGMIYKAVNTMDSMIAYKNERFRNFGFFAAKLDDILNFMPARISAVFMIFVSLIPGFNFTGALKIFVRDRYKHASPNSAQTESVCAGSLNIQLAGDTVYGGVVEKKEFIGDNSQEIRVRDIIKANMLMYMTSILFEAVSVFVILQ